MALDAVLAGAVVDHDGDYAIYHVEDKYLKDDVVEEILAVDGTYIDDYWVKRWFEVDDLDAPVPADFPNSTVDSEGKTTQRKWSDVVTDSTLKIGDKWYPEVAYVLCGEPRGLTYSEYKSISEPLLTADEVNALKTDDVAT